MVFARMARFVPANGILFAAFVVLASLLTRGTPNRDSSDATVVAYYSGGERDNEIVSFFLIGLAVFCFLSFLGSLRGVLARVEGEPARLTTAATASGVAFIALAAAAHVVGTSVAFAAEFYDGFDVDANMARLALALSYGFFVMSLFAAAAMTAAAAVLSLWLGALPRWLGWFGLAATAAGLLGFLVVPSLVVLAWIAAASAWLLLAAHPRAADSAA
jgi:hypothetical protein